LPFVNERGVPYQPQHTIWPAFSVTRARELAEATELPADVPPGPGAWGYFAGVLQSELAAATSEVVRLQAACRSLMRRLYEEDDARR
jgi:hypothetical protein